LEGRVRHLPFLREAVSREPRLVAALRLALGDIDQPLEALAADNIVCALAEALVANDPSARKSARGRPMKAAYRAADQARQFLDAHCAEIVTSESLEKVSRLDRFTLTRQFRAHFGTAPYNYLIMRRLARARDLLATGNGFADAALAAGFSDQSHFIRQFKRAYGLTPGHWQRITR
jgi:AraC-like DNA-binding protein